MADPRFAVPLEDLERRTRVAAGEQVEGQAAPWQPHELTWSPVHRFGDGAGTDADGD